LCLLSEYGADINHVYDYDSPLDTIWKYFECEVFGYAHTALTPLLKVMTLLGDAPPSFKPRLSVLHACPHHARGSPASCAAANSPRAPAATSMYLTLTLY
jgi:hypothetical protein